MSNERKPLLSDEAMSGVVTFPGGAKRYEHEMDGDEVRDFYERLITEGRLRVVEEVDLDAGRGHSFIRGIYRPCTVCKTKVYNGDVYCPGCGNPIKRSCSFNENFIK
jgi:hypothetical protein